MPLIEHDVIDDVLQIRLNRPDKFNAVTDQMFDDLKLITDKLARSDGSEYGAVVLSGVGASFCAGLDFSVHQEFAAAAGPLYADPDDPESSGRPTGRGQSIVRGLRDCAVPVIVALQGHAIGAGLQFALGADIRIARPDAKVGVAEMDWGLTVDMGGSQLLPRLIGTDRAMDLLLTGRLISGRTASSIGLVTRLSSDPLAEAVALARQIAANNRVAVLGTKQLVRISETDMEEGFRAEQKLMFRNIGSAPQAEAAKRRFRELREKGAPQA